MLVDSHCHLDFPEFSSELDDVLSRARNAGVGHFLTIGTELAVFPRIRSIAESADDIHCSIGVHPHSAAKERLDGPEILIKECEHPKVAALGETGLDFYYENSPRSEQIADFDVRKKRRLAEYDAQRVTMLRNKHRDRSGRDSDLPLLGKVAAQAECQDHVDRARQLTSVVR